MSAIGSIMQTGNPKTGWGLWLQWVLASILGYGGGTTIGNALANLIPQMTCSQSFSDSFIERLTNFACIQPSLSLIVIVVIQGLAGGFMQWLVLRRRIAAAPILLGILFGVLSGAMPWLVLRRQNARAGWWLPAHLLGALVGGALGIVAFHSAALMGLYQFTWAAAGAMFGAGLGAVTGFMLIWLLNQSISDG